MRIRLRKCSQQFWPLLSGFRSWPNSILRLKRVVLNERPKPRFFVTGGRRLLFNLRHIASRMGWTANDPDRSHRPRALPFRGEPRQHPVLGKANVAVLSRPGPGGRTGAAGRNCDEREALVESRILLDTRATPRIHDPPADSHTPTSCHRSAK